MNLVRQLADWQRYVVAAVLLCSAIATVPAAVEPFMLPKATVVVLGSVVLTALVAVKAAWVRTIHVPTGPAGVLVAALAAALVLATATSAAPWTSLIGFYARYAGLLPYLSYLVLFLVVLRLADVAFFRLLSRAAVVAVAAAAGYGLLQAAGGEPFGFSDAGLGTTFSFFGNTNFGAAWVAAASALLLAACLNPQESRPWRIAAAVVLPLALLYIGLTETSQGPLVLLAASGVVLLLTATARGARLHQAFAARRQRLYLGAGAGAALVAIAVLLAGPFLRTQLDQALVERPDFWTTALKIFLDNPVLGTGLDTYAHHFLANRPAEHALTYGVSTTDAPHSVPLAMLSNGGLLLGAAYVAFVGFVASALVRGARRVQGSERYVLAGAGGTWAGYQVQSLVSFDLPPLALLHFLTAAFVVAVGWPPTWRSVSLPGKAATAVGKKKSREPRTLVVPGSTRALIAGTALVGLVASWLVLYPARADLRAASASPLTKQGRYDEAVDRFRGAARLNPGEATYSFLAAQGLSAAGRKEEALAAATEAARRDPGTVQYALFAGRTAQEMGDNAAAKRWYQEAADRDPLDPPVLNEVAAFLFAAGDLAAAQELAQRSARLRPAPESQALLDRIAAAGGG